MKNKKSLITKISLLFACVGLAIGGLCIGVKADTSDEYETGYNDGYNQGLNDAFENISTYSVISNFYQNAQCFISTNNGATFQNADSYISFTRNGTILNCYSSNGFLTNENTIYYIGISLLSPCNIKDFMLQASNRPNALYLEIENKRFDFGYTNIDNVGYIWANNIFEKTSYIKFYFKGQSNMSNTFPIMCTAFDTALESYEKGYNEAKNQVISSYETRISNLNDNITSLTNQVNSLNTQLTNGGGWQSMFFAMADTPFKTVQNMLGFDVLGVNLFGAFIGFITILAILWVLKKLIK